MKRKMDNVVLQSSLGGVEETGRRDLNMDGSIFLGQVIKVYHKEHTADVLLLTNQSLIVSSDDVQGSTSCFISENLAGFDEKLETSYGDITPIQEGTWVIVTFFDNLKTMPVILGCVHNFNNAKNVLPKDFPVVDDAVKFEKLSISRLQDYTYIAGTGEFEKVHHSGAFLTSSQGSISDARGGFTWENLKVKSKLTGKTVMPSTEKVPFKPLDLLLAFRSLFDEATAIFLRIYISAKKGVFRLARDTQSSTSYFEMLDDNTIRIRSQLDSAAKGSGSNFTEVKLGGDGSVTISKGSSGTSISISSSGAVNIQTGSSVDIKGSSNVTVTSSSKVSLQAPSIKFSVKPKIGS